MFEHFTFGACAQTQYNKQEETAASPTDTSLLPPSSTLSFPESIAPGEICDIVNALNEHTLRLDDTEAARSSIWPDTIPCPTFEDDPAMEELCYISTSQGRSPRSLLPPPPTKSIVTCRRMQRQMNTQLQSCSDHIKDINNLVEDMISSNSQCRVYSPASRSCVSSSSPSNLEIPICGTRIEDLVVDEDLLYSPMNINIDHDEDEGFAEMDEPQEEMSLRMAATPNGIRKLSVAKGQAEFLDFTRAGLGRVKQKIRCVPRMRKRKVVKT